MLRRRGEMSANESGGSSECDAHVEKLCRILFQQQTAERPSHDRGMGQGLELAERGGIEAAAIHAAEPWGGEAGEEAALQVVFGDAEAVRGGFGDEAGEIHVRGEIAEAGIFEIAVVGLMLEVAAQRSGGAMTEFVFIEAVISDEDACTRRGSSERTHPREHGEIDLDDVAGFEVAREFFELGGERSAAGGCGNELEISIDEEFVPGLAIEAGEMDRKGVWQLVAEVEAARGDLRDVVEPFHSGIGGGGALRFAVARVRFDDGVACAGNVERVENVAREAAIVRALLDEGEVGR